MRTLLLVLGSFLLISCQNQSPENIKSNLTGYWEIKTVQSNHIQNKEYTFNNTIDYIEIKGENGIRTKLQPNYDGTFSGNNTSENFTIEIVDNHLDLHYKTPFDQWTEKVKKATSDELIIENKDGIEYHYVRYEPLNIE